MLVEGAVVGTRERCGRCGARLWAPRRRRWGDPHTPEELHTVAGCDKVQAYFAEQERLQGRQPKLGPGSPDVMKAAF